MGVESTTVLVLAVIFLGIMVYFKSVGGYRVLKIEDAAKPEPVNG